MSTALGSDVYMGANEPVNSCGQICLLPTGDGPGIFHARQPMAMVTLPGHADFAAPLQTISAPKRSMLPWLLLHMRLNRSKRHGTGELSVPSQMGH